MKMYDEEVPARICGDCTDLMMRSPVCAQRLSGILRETADEIRSTTDGVSCGVANEWSDTPLAIVSSPYQGFGDVFDCPHEALKRGTLFRLLDLPITDAPGPRGRGGCKG